AQWQSDVLQIVWGTSADGLSIQNLYSGALGSGFLNTWHHVAATYDGSTAALYVDGVQLGSSAVSGPLNTSGYPVESAARTTTSHACFQGQLDEVRIWNSARSASQIGAAMHQRLMGTESGLAAYWPLEESVGTTTADGSGQGHGGTLSGSTLPIWITSGAGLTSFDTPNIVSVVVSTNNLSFG